MTGNVLFLFVEVFRLFQNLGLMLVYVCFVSDLCMDRFCRFDSKKGLTEFDCPEVTLCS